MADPVSSIVCKAFLDKCAPEKRSHLLALLPEAEKERIQSLPQSFENPLFATLTTEEQLSRIHPSWLTSFFRTLTENEAQLFLAAVNENQASSLKKALLLSEREVLLSQLGKKFLQESLWKNLTQNDPDLLPIACLPESSLNSLLNLGHSELVRICDFLGIYDFALEIKQIVETAKIKKIYQALTPEELSFLKNLLHQKENLAFKAMGLQQWDGNVERLRTILHQRGINRLAKALYYQHPDLKWHVAHKLDMQRATVLLKLCTDVQNLRAAQVLTQQVLDCISYLQTKRSE
jgi:hypothetical protein